MPTGGKRIPAVTVNIPQLKRALKRPAFAPRSTSGSSAARQPLRLPVVHPRVTFCLGASRRKVSMTASTNTPGTDEAGNQTSPAAKDSATPSGAAQQRSARTATVNLPFVTATFRKPDIHLPHIRVPNRQQALSAAQAAQSYLPSPKQAAYFGGLAALAAFEILEWPVALAIGAGTALMGRSGQGRPQLVNRPQAASAAAKQNTSSADETTASAEKAEPA
jgi:hypothetical protein